MAHTVPITSMEQLLEIVPPKKWNRIVDRLCVSTRILFPKTPDRHSWSLMQNPFYYQNHNVSFDKVAEIFKVNEKTIRRWVEIYEKEGLDRINKKKMSYKVKEKHVK